MTKYRLYIDESGNHDLKNVMDPTNRYLGLTGIAIDLNIVRSSLGPKMEKLKQDFFPYDPDSPPILHRKELVNRRYPFHTLNDPSLDQRFKERLIELVTTTAFIVFSVVIDKLEHRDRYKVWRYHPYHYCMAVLIERYILFLEAENCHGDVMAESRGGIEDIRLKKSYTGIYEQGTEFMEIERIQTVLTSKELKISPKSKNISGLQLADLIAHPCKQQILYEHGKVPDPSNTYGYQLVKVIEDSKYYRSPEGTILGYGKKLLP